VAPGWEGHERGARLPRDKKAHQERERVAMTTASASEAQMSA